MSRYIAICLVCAGCSNPARGVPIFLWHGVGQGCAGGNYDVSPEEFDHELSDLERFGATPITLRQLFDARDGHGKLPARPVVLSFDDGRLCQLTVAAPILARHHMVAESFVLTGLLADDAQHRQRVHDANGEHAYLDWPEVQAMDRSGTFVIESHGVTHPRFSELPEDAQRRELTESKAALESKLGRRVEFFAYPFGSFTGTSKDLAEQAGYRGAVTVQKGLGSRFAMKRVSLLSGNEPDLVKTLRDAFGEPR